MAVPRLKERFVKEVVSSLKEKFQYKSVMQVPKITKIVINKGVGAAVSDKKLVDVAVEEITLIAVKEQLRPFQRKRFQTLSYVKTCLSV
jgi:large subunit ribosomal protein L5